MNVSKPQLLLGIAVVLVAATASYAFLSGPAPTVTNVPEGYTLDNYVVEERTEVSCQSDEECVTPSSYLIQSRCPFTSLCLENKCAVVCPSQVSP